jgi:hypothetical protein
VGASTSGETLGCPLLFGEVQPGAMLFPQLLCRNNTAAKVCELHKLMLNSLEPLPPLAVSDLITCSIPAVTPKLLIQLLNVSDLHSETPDLVPKDPKMIHMLRIAYPDSSRHDCTKHKCGAAGSCAGCSIREEA